MSLRYPSGCLGGADNDAYTHFAPDLEPSGGSAGMLAGLAQLQSEDGLVAFDGSMPQQQQHQTGVKRQRRHCTADSLLGGGADELKLEIAGLDQGSGSSRPKGYYQMDSSVPHNTQHTLQRVALPGYAQANPVATYSTDDSFASHQHHLSLLPNRHQHLSGKQESGALGTLPSSPLQPYGRHCQQRSTNPAARHRNTLQSAQDCIANNNNHNSSEDPLLTEIGGGPPVGSTRRGEGAAYGTSAQEQASLDDMFSLDFEAQRGGSEPLTDHMLSGDEEEHGEGHEDHDGHRDPPRRKRLSGLSEEMRRDRRRQSNRESARRSRARKLEEIKVHEDRIAVLSTQLNEQKRQLDSATEETEALRRLVRTLEQRSRTAHSQLAALVAVLTEDEESEALSSKASEQLAAARTSLQCDYS